MEDTDAGGIVYHANYIRYCERARSDLVREFIDLRYCMEVLHRILVIKSINIEYKKPALLGDLLRVTAEPTQVRRTSIRFTQRITHYNNETDLDCASPSPGSEICVAEVLVAVIDKPSMKLAKMPDEMYEQCLKMLS